MIEPDKLYRIKGNSTYFREKYGTPNPLFKVRAEDTAVWGGGWKAGGYACDIYGYRCAVDMLPLEGKVYYGYVFCAPLTPGSSPARLGEVVHESELEPYEEPLDDSLPNPNITLEKCDPRLFDPLRLVLWGDER